MKKFEFGTEISFGGRWAHVVEVLENGLAAFVADQEGEIFEITLGEVEHFYSE